MAEYSPPKSPLKPGLASGTSVVPESPGNYEGNISGTTFLPQEESDPDDGALEPIIMIDELPGLQEATDRLLNLVKASAPDAKQAVDAARKLANPRNTENKRLKPAIRKLMSQMKPFGAQRFIDVDQAQRLIPTVQPKDADRPWSPLPALQRANCARMVLDLLLAGMGLNSHSEAIRALDSQFPEPLMSQVVEGNEPAPIGGSAALKSTFELALEIRTQFAIVELERQAKDVNARSVIESVFYGDGYTSDNDPLRGFNLQGTFADENGHLPSQFQDKVNDRFSELDFNLYDDEGNIDIKGLKSAFRNRFLISTARFVQIRDKELRQHLELQPKLEDVKEFVEEMIENGANADDQETSEQHLSAIPSTSDRSPEEAEEHEGGGNAESAEKNENQPDYESDTSGNQLFVPWSPSPLRHQKNAPMSPEQRSPSQPAKEPTPKSAHRRQSSKQ